MTNGRLSDEQLKALNDYADSLKLTGISVERVIGDLVRSLIAEVRTHRAAQPAAPSAREVAEAVKVLREVEWAGGTCAAPSVSSAQDHIHFICPSCLEERTCDIEGCARRTKGHVDDCRLAAALKESTHD
jgi:hypothetical protein